MSDKSIVIRPVSNWANLAAQARRNGCPSVADFILRCLLVGVHIPPRAMRDVYAGWRRESEER